MLYAASDFVSAPQRQVASHCVMMVAFVLWGQSICLSTNQAMVNAAVCASQYMVAAARQEGRDELWPAKRDLRREIGFCLEFSRGIAVGVACLFLANMKRMGRRAGGLQRVVCDIAIDGHGTAEARCMR